MRSILTYIFMLVIVSVQFVDLAVFDYDHSQASETNVVLDSGVNKMIPAGNAHCSDCDSLHHMNADKISGNLTVFINASKHSLFTTQIADDAGSGPPVPPPLS